MVLTALPKGTGVSWRQLLNGICGNVAASLWWAPGLAKRLYQWRGARFHDRASVFLGRGVVIDNRHPELLEIGADVWITAGCILLTHSYCSALQRRAHGMEETVAGLVIEEGAFIGAGSILLPGVRIGRGAYVAAGSVVAADVPPGMLVAGNPARVIRPLGQSSV
ncbi:acyltransferase [Azospirillum agricola]|uniref:acyltransferase n=1 Tax=Azospirillum agricola TaxID=1720247 RepID=UPI000A0F30F2|nr:acyltransferase [Azospirillum agricola]SMH41040.1 transferase hexapeptide (six repeat-containing protein) [Azospirillum lipoferum]